MYIRQALRSGRRAVKKIGCVVSTGLLVLFLMVPSAKAVVIQYTVHDLGLGRWEYAYYLSDATFNQFQGFQTDFDYNSYAALNAFPPAPNGDWGPITFDPDPGLFANGIYDAISFVSNASLLDPFVVSFDWSGVGQPGAQTFRVYSCDDEYCSGGITFGPSGMTVARNGGGGGPIPVPEPWSPLMFGIGLLGMAWMRRFR